MILKTNNTFHLQGKNISYIMAVNAAGDLIHIHYGKKLKERDYSDIKTIWRDWEGYSRKGICLDIYPQEYPAYGFTDLRNPAYSVQNKYGDHITHLRYKNYRIRENYAAKLDGMPSLFVGDKSAQTLEIELYDEIIGLSVILSYTVFDEYDVILRSAEFINRSDTAMTIDSAYSTNLDLPDNDYDIIYFSGAWAREREFIRQPIRQGSKTDISNARGTSGHSINPFIMISDKDATEDFGNVYGLSLIYSGNHSSMVECDQYGNIRVQQGINPFMFKWQLETGESFFTPQCVMCYSANGIGGLSRELSRVYRSNLCRSKWANKERPVLINNWEATYLDFDEERLLDIAKLAKDVGIEMFVMDAGWFGKEKNGFDSLGDWNINYEKLPDGLSGIADKINALGLKFGLWIEPENITIDSELYKNHPNWVISVAERAPALSTERLILDLSRDDVCNYITDKITGIIGSANIEYVKWDMNRPMTDMPQMGYNHCYTLGFYKIMGKITSAFPDVLFEGCCGGGGRFDAGVLAYMPQIWTSDNSDAVARLKIQYSTSMGYPLSTMTAHVTASPNHQCGRVTPLKTRAETAYAGVFGYELDITKLNNSELDEIRKQVIISKQLRSLVLCGDFYRLVSPYETNCCSWELVSPDKREVFFFSCRLLSVANQPSRKIKLNGLDENANYLDLETGKAYGGDELMYIGIEPIYEKNDFSSFTMRLKQI